MYDYIVITHLPSFYKVNLYNELSKPLKIFVVFIATDTDEKRAEDFSNIDNVLFDYEIINKGVFQTRNKLSSIVKIKKILHSLDYKKVVVSGWDLIEFWAIILTTPKEKNCLALESTIFDSQTKSIKGVIKRIFLSRIATVFASGKAHVALLNHLNYKGVYRITKGVGIINKTDFEPTQNSYQKKFLYVGRLVKEKNLNTLIKIFNELPNYTLTVIGNGSEKSALERFAKENIKFLGSINNHEIQTEYLANNMVILLSQHETWGLVVEEALYFGRPVIISKYAGACDLIDDGVNGYIVDPLDENSIKETILSIDNDVYTTLLDGVSQFSLEGKDVEQVEQYKQAHLD